MTTRKEQDANDLAQWTADIQAFQRNAGTELSTNEELAVEWSTFNRQRKARELESAATHLTILAPQALSFRGGLGAPLVLNIFFHYIQGHTSAGYHKIRRTPEMGSPQLGNYFGISSLSYPSR